MLWWVFGVLLSLLLAYIAIAVILETISRKRAAYYVKQGFSPEMTYAIPGFFSMMFKGKDLDNAMEPVYQRVLQAKREGAPGIVFNHSREGCALVQLVDVNLIREFVNKENDIAIRHMFEDFKIKMGFYFMNGEQAMTQRAVFGEFFRTEKLCSIIPSIYRIIDASFQKQRASDGTLVIPRSQEFIDDLMVKISNQLIFGEGAEILRIESGVSFSEELLQIVKQVWKVTFGAPNFLTRDWLNYLNILSESRISNNRARSLDKKLEKYLQDRIDNPEKFKEQRKQFCLINMMLDYNEKAKADETLTMEQMVGNCNLFLLGSYDSTGNALASMLFCLAHHQDVYEQLGNDLKHINRENLTFDELEKSEVLEKVIRESLRVNPPASFVNFRRLLADFSLGKYNFKKGDQIIIAQGPLMWDEDIFASCRGFDITSLNDQNKKNYFPFYMGKRSCVGQLLSQLELKLVAVYLANRFSLKPLTDRLKYTLAFSVKLLDCDVTITELK